MQYIPTYIGTYIHTCAVYTSRGARGSLGVREWGLGVSFFLFLFSVVIVVFFFFFCVGGGDHSEERQRRTQRYILTYLPYARLISAGGYFAPPPRLSALCALEMLLCGRVEDTRGDGRASYSIIPANPPRACVCVCVCVCVCLGPCVHRYHGYSRRDICTLSWYVCMYVCKRGTRLGCVHVIGVTGADSTRPNSRRGVKPPPRAKLATEPHPPPPPSRQPVSASASRLARCRILPFHPSIHPSIHHHPPHPPIQFIPSPATPSSSVPMIVIIHQTA